MKNHCRESVGLHLEPLCGFAGRWFCLREVFWGQCYELLDLLAIFTVKAKLALQRPDSRRRLNIRQSSPNYHSYDSTEIYLHFFLSENAKWLFMCYFTCEAQKIAFFAVLTWFILLGKIQDGDHFLVRSRASSSTILDLFFRKIRAQIQDSWRGWIW